MAHLEGIVGGYNDLWLPSLIRRLVLGQVSYIVRLLERLLPPVLQRQFAWSGFQDKRGPEQRLSAEDVIGCGY